MESTRRVECQFELQGTKSDEHCRHGSATHGSGTRRGVAVVVALGLLAITLAVSYTLLRTQATASAIGANANRSAAARQASLTGIQIALKRIHDPDWGGVTVPISGNTSATDSFQVTFLTGDSSLAEGDADYQEYPYRLTLESVGTSVDPADANRKAEYTTRVVVQLIRERIADPPADWNGLLAHTLTQWKDTNVTVNFPCRVEGPVRIGGTLLFCEGNPPLVRPFDGTIDEVAVLTRRLSESELLDLYQGNTSYQSYAGDSGEDGGEDGDGDGSMIRWWRLDEAATATTATDSSGVGHGIYEGGQPGALPSPFGGTGSAQFDGEVDGITVGPVNVSTDNFTLMGWFKADDFGNSQARIISKTTGTSESDHVWMLSTTDVGSAHRLRFRLKALGITKTLVASSGDLPTGQWLFAAATYDGLVMRLYLNGQLVGSALHTGLIDLGSSATCWIGENAPGAPRGLYFRHLNRMQADGLADYRPFNDTLSVASWSLDDPTRMLLQDELGVTLTTDSTKYDYSGFDPPKTEQYQLYPGGAVYEVPALSSTAASQTLEPDVTTNPLGVYWANSNISLGANLTLRGALLADDDVSFDGTDIRVEGVDLPPLEGASGRKQLPCLAVGHHLKFLADSTSQVEGMLVVRDSTRFAADGSDMSVELTGRLATARFDIEPRDPWSGFDISTWNYYCRLFDTQRFSGGTPYLPEYLDQNGLNSQPQIILKPTAEAVGYHWHDWSQPLYLPAVDGDGLRWRIIRWQEGS